MAILDGTRLLHHDGHVRIQAVCRHLEPKLQLARASASACTGLHSVGPPLSVDAATFDLVDHLQRARLEPSDQRP
jgi:hypothetical protein